jgi:hypothetical protein
MTHQADYDFDGPCTRARPVAVEGAAGDCVATNCAIGEQHSTTPAQGRTNTEGAISPKLEKAMKELGILLSTRSLPAQAPAA